MVNKQLIHSKLGTGGRAGTFPDIKETAMIVQVVFVVVMVVMTVVVAVVVVVVVVVMMVLVVIVMVMVMVMMMEMGMVVQEVTSGGKPRRVVRQATTCCIL